MVLRRKQAIAFAVPLAVLAYLVYAHFAFDVPGLIERAEPQRVRALLVDLVQNKVHVTKDNRTGAIDVTIEGERNSTFQTSSVWAEIGDERVLVDLGEDYSAEFLPRKPSSRCQIAARCASRSRGARASRSICRTDRSRTGSRILRRASMPSRTASG